MTVTILDDVYNERELTAWRKRQDEYEAFRKESEEDFLEKKEEE